MTQFKAGKHAAAWAAMKAMPTFHYQPMAMTEGMKGCGACHKIGLKTDAKIATLRKEGNSFGTASCDACHTRHTFSVAEARQPQACETCMEHRIRTFQATFHANPDYALWYGWSAMRRDLTEIMALAEDMRRQAARKPAVQ